jgi:hypothetical protein
MSIEIPNYPLREWIDELQPSQKEAFNRLLGETGDAAETARLWITTQDSGIVHLARTAPDKESWWSSFREEFDRFVCDDDAYVKEKKALRKEVPITNAILISTISTAIALKIGFTAAFLGPAVAAMLSVVGKMTRNSYCAARNKRRSSA